MASAMSTVFLFIPCQNRSCSVNALNQFEREMRTLKLGVCHVTLHLADFHLWHAKCESADTIHFICVQIVCIHMCLFVLAKERMIHRNLQGKTICSSLQSKLKNTNLNMMSTNHVISDSEINLLLEKFILHYFEMRRISLGELYISLTFDIVFCLGFKAGSLI